MASSISLGVPLMDEDHAHLEEFLLRVPNCPDGDLPALLVAIEAETRAHFAREEDLMRARNVPILSCHQMQHQLFLAEFRSGHRAVIAHDWVALRRFMDTTLPRLLTDHINTVDRVTAEFLCAEEGGSQARPLASPGQIMAR